MPHPGRLRFALDILEELLQTIGLKKKQTSPVFKMYRGEVYLGKVTMIQEKCNFPWVAGKIEPTNAFDEVRELSQRILDLESGERSKVDMDKAYELLLQMMEPGILLRNLSSDEWLKLHTLNIEGNMLAWRWA